MADNNLQKTFEKFKEELSGLAQYVDDARKGIDEIESTFQLSSQKFPEASGQLSTVSGDLENAANNIMSLLENLVDEHDKSKALIEELSALAGTLPDESASKAKEVTAKLEGVNTGMKTIIMDMFANSSFHDLSGQKLKKVISTLSGVEAKILDMACNFGIENKGAGSEETKSSYADGKGDMFNQSEVDKILNDLKLG